MTEEYDETYNDGIEDQNIPNINIDIDIPEYLPLNPTLVSKFDKAAKFQIPLHNTIKLSKQDLLKEVEEYIEHAISSKNFERVELTLNNYLESLQEVIEASIMLDAYKDSIDSCKDDIKQMSVDVPKISKDTLEEYRYLEGINFGDLIINSYNDNKDDLPVMTNSQINTDLDYQFIKNVHFIIKNPQDALPDDAEDDELRVSGGKVSLKDPITLNYFETPVISSICRHTFEKSTIEDYLKENDKCPINGCRARLRKDQLQLDKLMGLRVKVFLATQAEPNGESLNIERIV